MAKGSSRLVSLDIFRGMTLAFMIIVNTPGSWKYIYPPLRHSEWNGCTPTDLVFPFFLFIVGVSLWFSMKKYKHSFNGGSVLRIFRRVLAIFLLGIFLAVFPYFGRDYSTLRIMGVLQRIALAYGIGALICLAINRQYLWIVLVIILLSYWGLLLFFGGAHSFGLEGNLVTRVDLSLLGAKHLYKGFGIPFDPEGLLSTLPAVGTVIIGFYCGEIAGKSSESKSTFFKLFIIGAGLAGLGLLWNKLFPINKPLWTSSYVLYTAGIAMMILSLLYVIADRMKFQKWSYFFLVLGTNSLFVFFLSGIWTRLILLIKVPSHGNPLSLYEWFWEKACVPVAGNTGGSLMFAIINLIIIWSVALILYRKKIMIRL